MARIARKNMDSCYFHVITQGYEKQFIFESSILKMQYLKLLLKGMETFNVEILEYCIMDNHAHILLYCEKIEEMSNYMQYVNSKFANYYNEIKKRVGYVFRDRFLSEPILTQKYLYSCMSYIHMNPVVARMVSKPEQYKYSSYNDFINGTGIVNDSVLLKLFETTENYLELFYFIHFEVGIGMEYKKDVPKLDFEEAKGYIDYILHETCILDLRLEFPEVQKFFYKLFLHKGIGIYQMEKILKIDHRKIKKAILC